jgi:hypothetical protein
LSLNKSSVLRENHEYKNKINMKEKEESDTENWAGSSKRRGKGK